MKRYRLKEKMDSDGIMWIYPQKRFLFFWFNIEYGNFIGGMRFWGGPNGEWGKAKKFIAKLKERDIYNFKSKIVYK